MALCALFRDFVLKVVILTGLAPGMTSKLIVAKLYIHF